MPKKRRPVSEAAMPVVLLPANGSNIQELGFVDARIILVNRVKGFCVGCFPQDFSQRDIDGKCHTSVICFPPLMSFISS